MSWLYVFLGGGLGSLARYGVARLLPTPDLTSGEMPWATLIANFLACITLGVLLGAVTKEAVAKPMQLLLMTGFCGGFSTFSTFAAEAWLLGEEGFAGVALGYVCLSLCLGVGALWFALILTR